MTEHIFQNETIRTDTSPELIRHFVATVFIVDNGKVLLLWHKKMQMWLPPGGHIEDGELPDEAAVREVREETGLEIQLIPPETLKFPGVRMLHQPLFVQLEDIAPGHQHIDLIYLAKPVGGQLNCNRDEAEWARWFDASDLDSDAITEAVRAASGAALETADRLERESTVNWKSGMRLHPC